MINYSINVSLLLVKELRQDISVREHSETVGEFEITTLRHYSILLSFSPIIPPSIVTFIFGVIFCLIDHLEILKRRSLFL